jgi:hypothetical protein
MAESTGRVDRHCMVVQKAYLNQVFAKCDQTAHTNQGPFEAAKKGVQTNALVTINACKRAGWVDAVRMEAWVTNGYLPRIVVVTYFPPGTRSDFPMGYPTSNPLPPQPTINLLLSMVIPQKAWSRKSPRPVPQKEAQEHPGKSRAILVEAKSIRKPG